MNKRRLLKLADLLEADANNKKGIKFDLGIVGGAADWDADQYTPGVDCGTTACAMGLAAISGAFKSAGLSYHVSGTDLGTVLNGNRVRYWYAATKVFDISETAAHFLFTPNSYDDVPITGAKGERYVAKRIRDFVAGKVSPA